MSYLLLLFIIICEHWLKVNELNSISDMCGNDYLCFLKSSIDPSNDLRGRPYGGTGYLCKKKSNVTYKIIECNNDRLYGLKVLVNQTVALSIIGVYLPFYDSSEGNTELYIDTLVSLQYFSENIMESQSAGSQKKNYNFPMQDGLTHSFNVIIPMLSHKPLRKYQL